MKTIKIIDLLNKIANSEEVPKRIKYSNCHYKYEPEKLDYRDEDCKIEFYLFAMCTNFILNDEVEIIEEDEEIEELNITERRKREDCYPLTVEIMAKINELVKEVNKLKNN